MADKITKAAKSAIKRERADTQLTAAQGEAVVLYELMWRGWIPANVNQFVKNARNIDIVATNEFGQVSLSVKTAGKENNPAGRIRLGGSAHERAFNQHRGAQADFIVFVLINGDSSKKYRCFVVPTEIAERTVHECHCFYLDHEQPDGQPRKDSGKAIYFFGKDKASNIAYEFAETWAVYEGEDAWKALASSARETPQRATR